MNFMRKFFILNTNYHFMKNVCKEAKHFNLNRNIPLMSRKVHFRCGVENPVNHTLDHEGMFYTVSPEVQKKLFSHGGFETKFRTDIKTFNECCLMIRRPTLEIINYMKLANYSIPVIKYIMYGREGVGKTIALAHLIHYAFSTNWLIVHVPWAPFWVRMFKEITPSTSRPGRMDQPNEGVIWLYQFKSQNNDLLQTLELNTSQKYTWSIRETSEEGTPLMSIVDHGLNRPKHSCDCVAVILKELKIHASAGKVKLFVAIDGINSLFHGTTAKREDKSPIWSNDITLVHAFRKFIKADWHNGVIVGIADQIAANKDRKEKYFPLYLFGREGFEILDPFVPILIENYSEKEISNCLDYYCDCLWIQNPKARTEEGKKELMFLSGFNPAKLAEICAAC